MYVVICRSQSFYEHVGMYVCTYVRTKVHHNIFPGEYLINLFIKKWNLLFSYELPVPVVTDPLMHPIFFWSGISDRSENKNYSKKKIRNLKRGILTS